MKLHCTICTELYERCSEITALSCGHLFHNYCINKWLQSSSSCPQCRKKLGVKDIIQKLYLDHVDEVEATQQCGNSERAENELSSIRVKLTVKEQEKRTLEVKVARLEDALKLEESKFTKMQTLYQEEQITSKSLKKQLDGLKGQQEQVKQAKLEVDTMRQYLKTLQNVETIVNGAESDAEAIIAECSDMASVKQLATFCVVYKRELEILKQTKSRLKDECDKHRRAANTHQREISLKNERIKRLERDVMKMVTCPSPATPQPISRGLIGDNNSPVLTPQPLQTCRTNFDRADDPVVATLDYREPPANKRKHSDDGKALKIRTAGHENIKKPKSDSVEIAPMFEKFSLMRKQIPSNSTADKFSLRTGYDGLGSHGKFIPTNVHQKPKQIKMSNFFKR